MGTEESNNIQRNKIKNEVMCDEKGFMDDETTLEYILKAQKSTCCIINTKNNKRGSGFFCKIPYTADENILLNVLITCEHVLPKEIIFSDEDIKLIVNNKEKIISLKKKRKRWSDKDMDYSCVEILNEDNIEDYYRLDDIFNKNYTYDKYINKNIVIFSIMNKKRGHDDGVIKIIDKFLFVHNCNTLPGSSGGVIINKNNGLVIGLHKGEYKGKNVGIFIRHIIRQIILNRNTKLIGDKEGKKNNYMNNINYKNYNISEMNKYLNNNNINNNYNNMSNKYNNVTNKNINNNIMNQMNNSLINQMNFRMFNPKTNQMPFQMNNPMMNQIKYQNLNQMNNQIVKPMMNNPIMNQINNPFIQQNQYKEITFNDLNPNQIELVNSIIKFYEDNKSTNQNEFMNYEHPQQIKALINHLYPNYSQLIKKTHDYFNEEELFSHINEAKKKVNFINSNKEMFTIPVPCSITKSDLYVVADLFKGLKYTNIILVLRDKILNNDDSSIENITEGDNIIIIEDRIYPEKEYYFSIKEKYKNHKMIWNIIFDGSQFFGKKIFVLAMEATMEELINCIYLFYGIDSRDLRIMYSMRTLYRDKRSIQSVIFNHAVLMGYKKQNMRENTDCRFLGKIITAQLLIDNSVIEVKVGRLNNSKVLFCGDLEHGFGLYKKNMRNSYNIYVKKYNIEIKYEDNQSFFSLGIKDDFECFLKLKKRN